MREVHDQVAFVQIEKTVDRPRFLALAASRLGPPNLGASEQLVVADHNDAVRHHAEAARDFTDAQLDAVGNRPSERIGGIGFREQFHEPVEFALVVAGDQDLLVATDNLGQLADDRAL